MGLHTVSHFHAATATECLPPHPPLQINRKKRKGSKETKLKQNQTHAIIKASETIKTPDENILEITKALQILS